VTPQLHQSDPKIKATSIRKPTRSIYLKVELLCSQLARRSWSQLYMRLERFIASPLSKPDSPRCGKGMSESTNCKPARHYRRLKFETKEQASHRIYFSMNSLHALALGHPPIKARPKSANKDSAVRCPLSNNTISTLKTLFESLSASLYLLPRQTEM
jgi:hypothetical protein